MIFLKSISDLRSLMESERLFSGDPVTFQIPELNPGDSITYESRINCLKNEKGWDAGIKGGCVVMAVLSGIALNIPGYGGDRFFNMLPFILLLGVITGIAIKFISLIWVRLKLKSEMRKILRRIYSLEKIYSQNFSLD